MTTQQASTRPLDGVVVIDATRMLPGAVLARNLLDLGAHVIKVEDPRMGDPMRLMPPLHDGIGLGFVTHYGGAWSVGLDLRQQDDAATFRRMVGRADVVVESFRPGTMKRWGLSLQSLRTETPRLVTCALPGVPEHCPGEVGHDLNYVGALGMLGHLGTPPGRAPSIQLADVTAGLLATSGVLAALFQTQRTGVGVHVSQPLATAPLPFLHWSLAEHTLSGASTATTVLAGDLPCYRTYPCGDDLLLSVGCLEPKFWRAMCAHLGLEAHAAAGLDTGTRGAAAVEAVSTRLRTQRRDVWVAELRGAGLPVGPVHEPNSPGVIAELDRLDPVSARGERPSNPGGPARSFFSPEIGQAPVASAPRLNEHEDAVQAWIEERT